MTTIFSVIDASILRSQQDHAGPPPAQDFAHELAKHPAQAKQPAQGHGAQSDEKAANYNGFEQDQTFEPVQAEPVSNVDKTLPQVELPTVVAQLANAEEHVAVAPIGVTETLLETRIFGWHAMAQAYLSELSTADGQSDPRDAKQADQTLTTTEAEAVSKTPASVMAASLPEAAEESVTAAQLDVLPKAQQSVTLDDTTPANAVEPAVTDASATGFWPERSLRFTRQRDGSSVAWLRDFRLGDAEASHLIRLVLSDAKEKGVVLSRIMLNGREVWTSPSIS
ncbi:hypothetical protein [Dyella acidisoli]|uniref:Toxin co-regulated pilus biosynthesis protein Q C-terminal domain-containing protein n=1 Tax=Dyella acidisoli TaxID=1867834 RepID=A0ABQ5XPT1_9GAMM|nr:hypothetical protein [Dyella acidisoli]GLQ92747.1 hypothetical protein GCM10007901_16980 [Dyella acidisoli]